jgi:hypothetical protein
MLADEIQNFDANFRRMFIVGIPCLLNDAGAYLSFGCCCSAIEAAAGYRYPDEPKNGAKFKRFLVDYMPSSYHALADQFWDLRNSLIHGFSPKHFALCHWQPQRHFSDEPPYVKVLNAESFFDDVRAATENYLSALHTDSTLQALFGKHLSAGKGGGLYVG